MDVELEGMYEREGSDEYGIRWGQKEGKINYTNYSNVDITRIVSFEIFGMDNINADSNIVITINGKEEVFLFEEGIARCNLKLLIPANSRESISWTANVDPVSLEAGRELYIAFRGYDYKWDMQEK